MIVGNNNNLVQSDLVDIRDFLRSMIIHINLYNYYK